MRLILVDALNLIWRYVYTFDRPDKAVGHAIANILQVSKDQKADGIIIVWDGGSDRRKSFYPAYKLKDEEALFKAGAPADISEVSVLEGSTIEITQSPAEVQRQDELERTSKNFEELCLKLKNSFDYCGLVQIMFPGEEADDVIYTMVKSNMFGDCDFTICSNDKDYFALLDERVMLWRWDKYYQLKNFLDEWEILPGDWVKLRSLMGDPSDNVPGVKGIGPKKAQGIIKQGKYEEFVKAHKEKVELYLKVLEPALLDCELFAPYSTFGVFDRHRAWQMFEFCKAGVQWVDYLMELNRSSTMRSWKIGALGSDMSFCTACDLRKKAQQVVVYRGELDADILVVGEGPGEEEDASGKPFCGRAGNVLDRWLETLGITNKVLISNVAWCRPSDDNGRNRAPSTKEAAFCAHLGIEPLIKRLLPKLIISLGESASTFISGKKTKVIMSKEHGYGMIEQYGYPIVLWILYHPASTFYSNKTEGVISEELGKLKEFIKKEGL